MPKKKKIHQKIEREREREREREIKFFVRKNYAYNGRENVKFVLKG